MNGQLELPVRQADSVAPAPPGDAGRETFTCPSDREEAERRADIWRRRGIEVEIVKRGRGWVVAG